jgi:CheY-like chemotaxis protein
MFMITFERLCESRSSAEMKNILVLDDNKEILEAVSARLSTYLNDCTVLTAADGAEGEKILKSTPIDLVITDLSMPVVSGYMLIEYAKKNYPQVPVCVMTANCSPEVIARIRAMGVGRWIEKPFKFEKLVSMIAEELNVKYND